LKAWITQIKRRTTDEKNVLRAGSPLHVDELFMSLKKELLNIALKWLKINLKSTHGSRSTGTENDFRLPVDGLFNSLKKF